MSVCRAKFANVEKTLWNRLKQEGLNDACIAGIMGNINVESYMDPGHLQGDDSFNGSSEAYTTSVNNGTKSRYTFAHDSKGYGLAQWTESSRKEGLYDYMMKFGNISDTMNQINYLVKDLHAYGIISTLKATYTTNSVLTAKNVAAYVCNNYEKPGTPHMDRRQGDAESYFNMYSGSPGGGIVSDTTSLANKIVAIAKGKIGSGYSKGGQGPDTFDSVGFIKYCYREAGVPIGVTAANTLNTFYDLVLVSKGQKLVKSTVDAGDIVVMFREITSPSGNVTLNGGIIAVGIVESYNGNVIYITESNSNTNKVISNKPSSSGRRFEFYRILTEVERGLVGSSVPTGDITGSISDVSAYVEDYDSLSIIGMYEEQIATNLENVQKSGFDYGYLIDLTHGGEFKFYLPDSFTEQAGVNWQDIDIIGRSVSVKAYNSTNSRSITIDLDLYASAGLYEDRSDPVGQLHKDLFFLKSLEYPDYSTAIVRPPATVQLILGSAINLVGVVSSVSIQHMKPLDSQNRSMYVKATFTVIQISNNPPDYSDIRNGQYVITSTSNINSMSDNAADSIIFNTPADVNKMNAKNNFTVTSVRVDPWEVPE